MSNKANVTLAVILGVLIVGSLSLYRVTEIERAVHLRFGAMVEEDVPPGLHFKIPLIDAVRKFDARVLTVDSQPDRFLTEQGRVLIVDSYAKFRVSDAGTFYRATGGNVNTARDRLAVRINDGLRTQFGNRSQQDVVSGERDLLMETLTNQLNETLSEVLGVEVLDVRIQRIDLPAEISDAVYARMRAEREALARQARSEGQEQAERIRADADRQVTLIEAEAYRQAEELRGAGDAEAATIYAAAYNKDPEFYNFMRSLSAYEAAFGSAGNFMVLEPDSDFFRYLRSSDGEN